MRRVKRQAHRLFIGLVVVLLWPPVAVAVQYNLRHYDTGDGVPQVQVLAVHQDARGYLWLGTYGGLSRYNGSDFVSFRTRDGLSSNFITAFATDAADQLWIGTGSGLCLYSDPGFGCIDHDALAGARVHALLAMDEGLWVGSDAGLFHLIDGQVTDHERIPGHEDATVFSLAADGSGRLWVGTSDGLFQREGGALSGN